MRAQHQLDLMHAVNAGMCGESAFADLAEKLLKLIHEQPGSEV